MYELRFILPPDENVKVAVVQDNRIATKSIQNPGALKITNATVLKYDPPAQNKPGVAIVRIEGAGFTPPPRMVVFVDRARRSYPSFVSPNEILVTVTNPRAPFIIRLRDRGTGAEVSKIVESLPAP